MGKEERTGAEEGIVINISLSMYNTSSTKFFKGASSLEFFEQRKSQITNEIASKNPNELLNISIEKYAEYLTSIYTIDFPEVRMSDCTVSRHESSAPASRFPPDFSFFEKDKIVNVDIVVFHIPFQGDTTYLTFRPSMHFLNTMPDVQIRDNEIQFEYFNFYDNSEKIQREFDNDLRLFIKSFEVLKNDFKKYNESLKDFIINAINERRKLLLAKNEFLSSFKVPLKINVDTPKTFAVPSPKLRDKIIIKKPTASKEGFVPEPTLGYEDYGKILKIIDDVGRNFERMPSIYKGKQEEDLRDHIIMTLDPNFEYGSVTGETFNKKGKTDILLRYDSSVVFVAECKFWSGEKGFYETIDQLLSYLTWRDSKTAIVIFVRTQGITPVLDKIRSVTPLHKCYITSKGQRADNWSEQIFHLPSDPNREVVVSILVFHLPK